MRVPVTGLLDHPGGRRELVTSAPPDAFGDDPWGPLVDELDGPIVLDLLLESVSGGILARGSIRATARTSCARCLAPLTRTWDVDVLELHRSQAAVDREDDGADEDDLDYRLVDGDTHLELDQMVRDALVVGQPVRTLCRPDCAGLCPTCGADRNTEPCDHGDERPVDPRWEALRGLRLPPPADPGADPAVDPAVEPAVDPGPGPTGG